MTPEGRIIELADELEPHIDRQAREGGLEWLSFAVHSHAGPLYERTFRSVTAEGSSGVAPLFRIGSQSKALAVCCVMRLVQRGLVGLDDPFCIFFPELLLPAASPLRRVSLLRLMRHQTSLPAIERPMLKRPDGSYRSDLPRLEPWRLLAIVSRGSNNAVGVGEAAFDYSDFGFALLAMVVERVSGRRFSAFAACDVLHPAGVDAFFPGLGACPRTAALRLVRGHDTGECPPATELGVLDPALGGIATAAAAAAFFHMLLTGRLLSPQLTKSVRDAAIRFGPPVKGHRYSPGMLHLPVGEGEARCIGHLGIFGGFCGISAYFPPAGITVSLQMNATAMQDDCGRSEIRQANPAGFVRGLFQRLRDDMKGRPSGVSAAIPTIWREPPARDA